MIPRVVGHGGEYALDYVEAKESGLLSKRLFVFTC